MCIMYSLEINQETYEGFIKKNDWNTFVLVVKVELFFKYHSVFQVEISMYDKQKTEKEQILTIKVGQLPSVT